MRLLPDRYHLECFIASAPFSWIADQVTSARPVSRAVVADHAGAALMKHAAAKSTSAARSTASRVVATIALATAATAVATPAMAYDGGHGHGHGGYGQGGHEGRAGNGPERARSAATPRSYEPAHYTEPNYE